MRGTTVPRKEQNKAFDEEIGQPDGRGVAVNEASLVGLKNP